MGRKNNADRGLYCRTLPSGKEVWCIRFAWQGRDIRRIGGKTKEQARRKLRSILTDLQRGQLALTPSQADTLAGAIERYRPLAKQQRNYEKSQAFFRWWTERLGHEPLQQLTPAKIERAQFALIEIHKSPSTVNRYTDWLRHILNREVKLGHLAVNPALRISRLQEPVAPIHQYSREQEAALMKALGPYGSWVRLAILTGMRQSEQFRIKKEWIQWEEGYIQIPTTKSNRPRIVLITPEIAEILHQLCRAHPASPYVFPSPRDPDRPRDPGAFYRRIFRPACDDAKIPKDLKWHTLRHTFGSRLAASGASSKQIQGIGGWSTERAASRYTHLLATDLRAVAERLSGDYKPDMIANS